MRLLFHGSSKTRRVRGGAVLHQRCPECGVDTTFHEVEVTTSAGVFFVDLLSSTDRAYQCASCDDTFDVVDTPAAPQKPPRDLAAELLAEREQRAAMAAERAAAVDDELAALKRKLGK